MKSFVKRALSHGTAVLCLLSIATGAQAVVYRITDLGDLLGGSDKSRAFDINNHGQVVGYSSGGPEAHPDWTMRAFVWNSASGMQTLTNLSGTTSRAYAINDSGQITGEHWATGVPSSSRAFRWDSGTVQNLGTVAIGQSGKTSLGMAINASGQVVGEGQYDNFVRAVVWQGGTAAVLDKLPNEYYSRATDINDDGLVVGSSGPYAFTYRNGVMTRLSDLPGESYYSYAHAVNNAGAVVGQSANEDGASAVLWTGSGILSLGDLQDGTPNSSANDINVAGQVVGVGTAANANGGSVRRAFVWSAESGMLDLNTVIDAGDPLSGKFRLLEAQAINDLGQIVGYGTINGVEHAFMLTPVPEPHQYGMMIAGLGMVGWMVRRRRIEAPVPVRAPAI
jgi:probable HAF family extracellular repeat protein